ncbi:hypothetical protein HBH61_088160 [Parastagonospora nodorum]|nr:hypothetical protein HBH52_127200 [Parastagonospora nodorum]KAH4811724.1 hypothetical protein HBH61_088160 [Parastagonospora nodorum]KAH5078418.1 hypothetical protein HBH95_097910 [Parastagonospora nodorum]KAH5255937.1 hypothetical protein HBI72_130600 [Parastagonospora nodorum]KAH5349343.1 hypothetical protein HBI48_172630 [Parastagonospora nodorum]
MRVTDLQGGRTIEGSTGRHGALHPLGIETNNEQGARKNPAMRAQLQIQGPPPGLEIATPADNAVLGND